MFAFFGQCICNREAVYCWRLNDVVRVRIDLRIMFCHPEQTRRKKWDWCCFLENPISVSVAGLCISVFKFSFFFPLTYALLKTLFFLIQLECKMRFPHLLCAYCLWVSQMIFFVYCVIQWDMLWTSSTDISAYAISQIYLNLFLAPTYLECLYNYC